MMKVDNLIDAEREYQDARKETEEEFKAYKNKKKRRYIITFISGLLFLGTFILFSNSGNNIGACIGGIVLLLLGGTGLALTVAIKDYPDRYESLKKKEEYLKAKYIEAKDIHDETFRRLEWCHENFPEGRTWDDLNIVEKEGYLGMYIEKYKEKVISDSSEYNVSYIESVFCYFFKTTYEEVLNFYTNAINYYRSQEYEKDLKAYENVVSKI